MGRPRDGGPRKPGGEPLVAASCLFKPSWRLRCVWWGARPETHASERRPGAVGRRGWRVQTRYCARGHQQSALPNPECRNGWCSTARAGKAAAEECHSTACIPDRLALLRAATLARTPLLDCKKASRASCPPRSLCLGDPARRFSSAQTPIAGARVLAGPLRAFAPAQPPTPPPGRRAPAPWQTRVPDLRLQAALARPLASVDRAVLASKPRQQALRRRWYVPYRRRHHGAHLAAHACRQPVLAQRINMSKRSARIDSAKVMAANSPQLDANHLPNMPGLGGARESRDAQLGAAIARCCGCGARGWTFGRGASPPAELWAFRAMLAE